MKEEFKKQFGNDKNVAIGNSNIQESCFYGNNTKRATSSRSYFWYVPKNKIKSGKCALENQNGLIWRFERRLFLFFTTKKKIK